MNPATTCGISSSAEDPTSWSRSEASEHDPVEVADTELGAAAPDRAGQYDARVAVEPEPHRRPPRGGGVTLLVDSLDDEPGVQQRPDPGRHGGARETGDPADLAAGERASVAHQGEDLARRGRPLPR